MGKPIQEREMPCKRLKWLTLDGDFDGLLSRFGTVTRQNVDFELFG